jgi:predicted site-specific integrase-resolvase
MTQAKIRLYTPAEMGALFRVDPKTITRWVGRGWLKDKVDVTKTPGGHFRFNADQADALAAGRPQPGDEPVENP